MILIRFWRAVAQLGSALEWGSRGPGFKSRQPDQLLTRRASENPPNLSWLTLPVPGVSLTCSPLPCNRPSVTAISLMNLLWFCLPPRPVKHWLSKKNSVFLESACGLLIQSQALSEPWLPHNGPRPGAIWHEKKPLFLCWDQVSSASSASRVNPPLPKRAIRRSGIATPVNQVWACVGKGSAFQRPPLGCLR
jgi:hypothetical protein